MVPARFCALHRCRIVGGGGAERESLIYVPLMMHWSKPPAQTETRTHGLDGISVAETRYGCWPANIGLNPEVFQMICGHQEQPALVGPICCRHQGRGSGGLARLLPTLLPLPEFLAHCQPDELEKLDSRKDVL